MKKLLLLLTVLVATAFQLNAQCIDEYYHPHGFPPGPEGSDNNPIKVFANLGEQVTMGDFGVSLISPWYYVTGWWDQPQVPGSQQPHLYYDVWGLHRGQFLTKWTNEQDYRDGVIYAVADPGHGFVFEFFRILHRPPPGCVQGTR